MTLSTLIVKLNADTAGFTKGMNQAQGAADKMAHQIKAAGKIAAGAFVAGGTAALALTSKVAAAADEIDKMSIRSGVARGRLQELKFVTDQLGVGFEGMVGTMEALTRRLPQIESGTSETAKSFQRLGVNLRGADGQLRDMDALFPDIIRSLSEMENETDRNAIATQIFGRRAFEIVPLLEAGGEEIDRLTERARSLGLVMTDVEIEKLVEFHDQVAEAKMQVAALAREFALGLLPAVRSTVTFMQENIVPGVRAFVGGIQIMAAEIDAFFFSIPARVEKAIGNAMANVATFFYNLESKLPQWAKDILGVGKQQEFLIKVAAAGVNMADRASAELDIIATALEEVRQGIVGGGDAAAKTLNQVRQAAAQAGAALAGLGAVKPEVKLAGAAAPQAIEPVAANLTRALEPVMTASLEAWRRTTQDLEYFGYELRVRAEQMKQQFTNLAQTGQMAGIMIGNAALDIASKFTPLGMLSLVLEGVFEALAPVIAALEEPFLRIGRLIGQFIAPILELFVPILRAVTWAFSHLMEAIGWLIEGIGRIITKIPGLGDFGLIAMGEQMQANARAARNFEEATNDAADALRSGLINAVRGFKTAQYAHGATAVGGSTPATGGGGGGGGPVNVGDVNINTSGDGRETYRNFYDELDQRTRGAGGSARVFFRSLPAPV